MFKKDANYIDSLCNQEKSFTMIYQYTIKIRYKHLNQYIEHQIPRHGETILKHDKIIF